MDDVDSFKEWLLYNTLRMEQFYMETDYDYDFKEYRDIPYYEIFSYLICSLTFICLSLLFIKRKNRSILRHALKA